MKRLLIILSVALLNFAAASADSFVLGYCSNTIASSIGSSDGSSVTSLSAAIQLSESMLAPMQGDSIRQVQIGLGNVTEYSSLYLFIRTDLADNSSNLCLQQVSKADLRLGAWNTITLATPIAITGEELFVGYAISANGNIVGCDGSLVADARSCWAKTVNSNWESYASAGYGNFCIRVLGESGNVIAPNVSLLSASSVSFTRPNQPFSVQGTLVGRTTQNVSSFDVVATIGTDTLKTEHFDTNIYYGVPSTFLMQGLQYAGSGQKNIRISVENVNGSDTLETNLSDNVQYVTIDFTNYCADRTLLLEQFTTEQCPNCPSGAVKLKTALAGVDMNKVAWMAHHVGYYTDGYTIDASTVAMQFYGSTSTYAPAVMIDRTRLDKYGLDDGNTGVTMNVNAQQTADVQAALLDRLNTCSPIGLNMKGTYNPATRELYVHISGKQYQTINSEVIACGLFITEDSIASTRQVGNSDSIYWHRRVLRYAYGNSSLGVGVHLAADSTFDVSCVIPIDASWNLNQLQAVAMVSGSSESDISAFNVYNAAKLDIDTLSTVVVPETSYPIAYNTGADIQPLNFASEQRVGAAIALTPAQLATYGSDLVALRFYLPNIKVTDMHVFVAPNLQNEYIYTKAYTPVQAGWQYVPLTPQQALGTTDTVYVGYWCTAPSKTDALAYEVSASAQPNGDWYFDGTTMEWAHLSSLTLSQQLVNTVQAMMTGGNYDAYPQYDMELIVSEIGTNGYVKTGEEFDITLQVTNKAVRTLHSFDFYKYLSTVKDTTYFTNLNIANGDKYEIKLKNVVLNTEGLHPFRPYVYHFNGNKLETTMTNNLCHSDFYAFDRLFDRTLLLEQYTSQSCSNCPAGTAAMNAAIASNANRVVVTAHHAGFVLDDYSHTADRQYATRFGVSSNPQIVIDRKPTYENTYAFHPGYLTSDYVDELLQVPAPASLQITPMYNAETRTLDVQVSGYCPQALANARLTVFLTENGLAGRQEMGGNDYVHQHVFRDVLTDSWGDALQYVDGANFAQEYHYTLPANYYSIAGGTTTCTPKNVNVVAFVANEGTSAALAEVYNTTTCKMFTPTAVNQAQADASMLGYVLDGKFVPTADYAQLDVYSVSGQLIASTTGKPRAFALPQQGVYVLRARFADQTVSVQKIVLN